MTDIVATSDNIVVRFMDNVTACGLFNENNSSNSLIYIPPTPGESANKDRWAIVISVGPTVDCCEVGSQVLIKQGMWTPGFKVDGNKFWKTEQQFVIAIRT